MLRLFISRQLDPGSRFMDLEEKGFEISHFSLIDILPSEFMLERDYDWIFFYSKNGIKSFFAQEEHSKTCQYAVMGQASAETFLELTGEKPNFIGDGSPDEIASQFISLSQNESVLFVKASHSLNSIANILKDNFNKESDAVIAYKNNIKSEFILKDMDILVFTSPMNAKAYFRKYPYKSERIFCIGPSTSTAIKDLVSVEALYPSQSNEEALFSFLMEELGLDDQDVRQS